jgi:membrane dipeptidase
MIRAIVKRNGVIGIVLFNKFLCADWEKTGRIKQHVTLAHFIKQAEHVREVAGKTDNIGLGSDLDGGFGSESIPTGVDTVADLPKIADALLEAGFSEKEVACIMGENWLRFLKNSLPT